MDNRMKKVLITLASDWKNFAHATCLSVHIAGYIDLDDKSDELKLESFLEELIKRNSSNYMILIENALGAIGKLDILNEIELLQASDLLKSYYIRSYGDSLHIEQVNTDVNFLMSNIQLAYINADDVLAYSNCEKFDEWVYLNNEIIALEEMPLTKSKLLLLSGIAGIGKTCFLQKCVFCWAKGLLWKDVDLVLYFEFKKLNKFSLVPNPQEMINKFYKNILKGKDVMSSQLTVMFIIDGLDEFIHLEHLYRCISGDSSNLPIVSTIMDVLSARNSRCVFGGRVEAIMKYQSIIKSCEDILHIQIMGFSNLRIRNYCESSLMSETLRKDLEKFITSSSVAKALLSVPFYTKAVCSTLSLCFDSYSLKTMTELQILIFLHFVQQINKTTEPLLRILQKYKQHILNVCNVAFNMLGEARTFVSAPELATVLDDNGIEPFGFIVKSNVSHCYQFVHLFLMKFCASVHLFFHENPKNIFKHERLCSCLPVACGLLYGDTKNFVSLITQLHKPLYKDNSWLRDIYDRIKFDNSNNLLNNYNYLLNNYNFLKSYIWEVGAGFLDYDENEKMFMECFFEAQASITDDLKTLIGNRFWWVAINDEKTADEVSHEKYFMEKFIDAGIKLIDLLIVRKNILSEDEKNFIIKCSTNVCRVAFDRPLKIDGWSPKHKFEKVVINISETFLSKNEFEGFLPWIRLAEGLALCLHEDTNFIDDICEWLRGSGLKWLNIEYCGLFFNDIKKFSSFCDMEKLKKIYEIF